MSKKRFFLTTTDKTATSSEDEQFTPPQEIPVFFNSWSNTPSSSTSSTTASPLLSPVPSQPSTPSPPSFSPPLLRAKGGSSNRPRPSFSSPSLLQMTDGPLPSSPPKRAKRAESSDKISSAFLSRLLASDPAPLDTEKEPSPSGPTQLQLTFDQELPPLQQLAPTPKSPKGLFKTSTFKQARIACRTLVTLTKPDGNIVEVPANRINLNGQSYITAEGPYTTDQADAFFSMLWQENATCFVTLIPYPPKKDDLHQGYRNHIDHETFRAIPGFTFSTPILIPITPYLEALAYNITHASEVRAITHIRYKSWPDRSPICQRNNELDPEDTPYKEAANRLHILAGCIEQFKGNGPVIVNCNGGVSRSPATIFAHQICTKDADDLDALVALFQQSAPYAPVKEITEALKKLIARKQENTIPGQPSEPQQTEPESPRSWGNRMQGQMPLPQPSNSWVQTPQTGSTPFR